mmetsp:Transcript_806/g.1734  ORF Transcript_806/g.1734 Transcript_806/m.1734 type:complete len:191 (+) Transcript_806:614-1186(+)
MANLCQSCFLQFNDRQRRPRLLECKHVFCEKCISKEDFVCSYCGVISSTPVNILPVVADLIPLARMCPTHPEHNLKFYCLNDNEGICSRCRVDHTDCEIFLMSLKSEQQYRTDLRMRQPVGQPKAKLWKCSECAKLNSPSAEICMGCGEKRSKKRPCLSETPGFEWTCDCGKRNFTGRCGGCRKYYQSIS